MSFFGTKACWILAPDQELSLHWRWSLNHRIHQGGLPHTTFNVEDMVFVQGPATEVGKGPAQIPEGGLSFLPQDETGAGLVRFKADGHWKIRGKRRWEKVYLITPGAPSRNKKLVLTLMYRFSSKLTQGGRLIAFLLCGFRIILNSNFKLN